jgi:hypothetical protein
MVESVRITYYWEPTENKEEKMVNRDEIRAEEPRDPGPVERETSAISEVIMNIRAAVDELEKAIAPILGPVAEPAAPKLGPRAPYAILLADNLSVYAQELGEIRDHLFALKRRVGL